jgi:hypothetical protein
MSITRPDVMVEPFGANAAGGSIQYPLPTPSQISTSAGRASLNDGFPPACFLPIAAGGIPVAGQDMQGILFWITAYLVALQSGMTPIYDAGFSTFNGGYPINAQLQKASGIGVWTNLVAGNTSDPDTGGGGWLDGVPAGAGYLDDVLTTGTHNNLAPAGFDASVVFLDLDISAGNAVVTGLAGGTDGQLVTVTPIGSSGTNTLTLTSLDAGSASANRFRLSTSIILTRYVPQTLRYSSTLDLWLPIS